MRVLLRGRAESITVVRDYGVTVSSAKAYDPDGGTDSGLTLTVTNGAVNATLLSAAAKGTETVYATGITRGKNYTLVTGDGRELPIYVDAVASTTVTLASRLPYAVASGYIKSVESTITLTVPSTYTSRSIEIEYTLSDAAVLRESFLVASRRLIVPVSNNDVLNRFPRLRNRAQGEIGFDVQINDVLTKARAQFWQSGLVLDDITAPALLKDFLLAELSLQLLAAGYDVAATGDRLEAMREWERIRDREYSLLLNATNLWLDTNENRAEDDGETDLTSGISIRCFRR